MSNKRLASILSLLAGLVFVAFVIFKLSSNKTVAPSVTRGTSTQAAKTTTNQDSQAKTTQPLTLAELKKHNTGTDCWTIITGNVYDITDYVPRHPGGDEILRACGADGTKLFTTRKTDSGETVGSGTPHSSGAEGQLQQYLLGQLKD